MSKSGRQYADEVRELRAAGLDFPASRGYLLADAANWNAGQKAAVTRAFNQLETVEADAPEFEPGDGLEPEIIEAFYEDSAGDNFESWDDIDYFDFDEGDEFGDEEGDQYDED